MGLTHKCLDRFERCLGKLMQSPFCGEFLPITSRSVGECTEKNAHFHVCFASRQTPFSFEKMKTQTKKFESS